MFVKNCFNVSLMFINNYNNSILENVYKALKKPQYNFEVTIKYAFEFQFKSLILLNNIVNILIFL